MGGVLSSLDDRSSNQGDDRHGFPQLLTSFLGRGVEAAELGVLLGARRFVTLTGAGGCGKSRLAVHVATSSGLGPHGDETWFCDMAPLQDPDLVVSAVAAAIGASAAAAHPVLDAIAARMESRSALLVIDGCEHLLGAVADLIEHLALRCPNVRFLMTSREPLGMAGEAVYHVGPLGLPRHDDDVAADSVMLFAERASLACSTFQLTAENTSSVVEICRRLDGIPLAVELAAAQCRVLEVEEVASELSRRFSILTGGPRRALARHRTLEASIEWSYQLLTEREAELLQQLSVFVGAFGLEAAEAVAGELDTGAMVTRLAGLVDKSLVEVRGGAPSRFRLLDAIREFAGRKLDGAGGIAAIRDRHLRYYADLSGRHDLVTLGPNLLPWIARLDSEVDNLRAALDWSEGAGDGELGYRVGAALGHYWSHRSADEGHARLQALLAGDCSSKRARADLLEADAELAWMVGDWEPMAAALDEGLVLAAELCDDRLRARLLLTLGWLQLTTSDATAAATMAEASAISEACGDEWYAVDAMMVLAFLAYMEGRVGDGVDGSRRAHARAEAMGNPMLIVRTSFMHLLCTSRAGFFPEAWTLFDSHATASAALAENLLGPIAAVEAALIVGLQGDDDARSRLAGARSRAEREHNVLALAHVALTAAILSYRSGDGCPDFDLVETLVPATGRFNELAWCQAIRARHELARHDLRAARAACDDADRTLSLPFTGWARPAVLVSRSRIAIAEADPKRAEALAVEAIALITGGGGRLELPEAFEALARALVDQGTAAAAGRCLGAAAALRSSMGTPIAASEDKANKATKAAVAEALGFDAAEAAMHDGEEAPLDSMVAIVRRRRGARKRPPSGWASLTPAEAEVVELVCCGLHNAEIADRLFVAPSTVKTHLAHVFAKLHVASRAQLVSLAYANQS